MEASALLESTKELGMGPSMGPADWRSVSSALMSMSESLDLLFMGADASVLVGAGSAAKKSRVSCGDEFFVSLKHRNEKKTKKMSAKNTYPRRHPQPVAH